MALLKGTSEADTITGTTQADTIYGYGGDDSLSSGLGADILYGGAGNDELNGEKGRDTMLGGAGDDTLWTDIFGSATLDGGAGNDLAVIFRTETEVNLKINISAGGLGMNIGDGTRLSSIERLSCTGGWGNDLLVGGDLHDVIDGYEGRDTIKGQGVSIVR
jgi:Ca2+-binding RTX toxin-like protein